MILRRAPTFWCSVIVQYSLLVLLLEIVYTLSIIQIRNFMHAPLYSTVSLIAEMFVSSAIFTVIYRGYKRNVFLRRLALLALSYEVLFNISYMAYRALTHDEGAKADSKFEIGLAIFHGTLSLVMFVTLVVFMAVAWKRYAKGINYFRICAKTTATFLVLWTLSVLSGVLFYFVEYLGT